jgi:transcription elongation GreA/GreB family factor
MAIALKSTARDSSGGGVYLSATDFAVLMDELESLRRALADDPAVTGARVGSVIRVRDRAGRTSEYELIGQPDPADAREKVVLGSRLGQALAGARRGDFVNLVRANGRRRRVRVIDVQPAVVVAAEAAG